MACRVRKLSAVLREHLVAALGQALADGDAIMIAHETVVALPLGAVGEVRIEFV